jgi:hypothetical protein
MRRMWRRGCVSCRRIAATGGGRGRLPVASCVAALAAVLSLQPAMVLLGAGPMSIVFAQQTTPAEPAGATLEPPVSVTDRRAVRLDGASLWLDVPVAWREISKEELAQLNAILPPDQAVNKFVGGFASGRSLGYPYLLVQRIPVRLQGRTAGQIAEGFNAVSIDEVRSGVERGLGDLVKNISLERPTIDVARSRMVQILSGQAPDGGGGVIAFKTLSVSYFTNDAIIGVYQYEEAAKFEAERAAFAALAESASFEPDILYVPAAAHANGTSARATGTKTSGTGVPLAAFIGGGIAVMIGVLIVIARRKQSVPPAS